MTVLSRMAGHGGRFARSLARGAGAASARFPLSAVLIVAVAILSNLAAEDVYLTSEETTLRLVAALYGAAAAAVVARLAMEGWSATGWPRAVIPPMGGVIIGAAVWVANALGVFAPALVAALTLAVPLAPFAFGGTDRRFWAFTLWTFVGVTLAFLSVLLFTLGISAILEMIRFLFEVGPSSRAYAHIYITALSLVGPLFALGRIPHGSDDTLEPPSDDRLVAGIRLLIDFVSVPLALAAGLVLHLYAVKILATGEVPKNEIGWIVTSYAVLVLMLRVVAEPFLATGAATTRFFARVWSFGLVVPLGLLAYAATLRIGAEGFTLERYYLVLGGIAAVMIILLQVPGRTRGDIRLMTSVPLALLALSSIGPWGVTCTVTRSQVARLQPLIGDGQNAGATQPPSRIWEIRSRLGALDDVNAVAAVLPILNDEQRRAVGAAVAAQPADEAEAALVALGFAEAAPLQREVRSLSARSLQAVQTNGFDIAVGSLFVAEDATQRIPSDAGEIAVSLSGPDLVIDIAGASDRFDVGGAVAALPPASFGAAPERVPQPVVDLQSASGRRIRIAIQSVTVYADDSGVQSIGGTLLLLRREDWPSQP
ncbi:DUF4153 domain-containing protein [Mangrovicella endophytica]|uniref:DUF4153 domain-containing protein n=1 Tax=Mangrovicella endophytica TaxID=2066697 RepID=UPI000C9EA9DF|nr:DUF4153 domain-containing protein [Mangrovicella endophytica]